MDESRNLYLWMLNSHKSITLETYFKPFFFFKTAVYFKHIETYIKQISNPGSYFSKPNYCGAVTEVKVIRARIYWN